MPTEGDVNFSIRADSSRLETDLNAAENAVRASARRTEQAVEEITAAAENSSRAAGEALGALGESAREAGGQYKSFSEELDDINALLEKDSRNTALLAQKKQLLSKAAAETSLKLSALRSRQEEVTRAYRNGEIPDEEYRGFQREIIATEQELDEYRDELNGVGKASEDTAEKTENRLGGAFAFVAKGAAAASAAIGAAAVAAGTAAVISADALDKAVSKVIAATGAGTDEAERYAEVIKGVYADNFGESFEDIAGSVSLITQNLGELDNDSLKSITESAYALQDVFGMDVAESSRAAKAMSDNFGIAAQDAFDYIAKGAQNGLNYSGELIDSISEYSVQFAKLGFSADDMFAIFEQGAENGAWNLDKIGDAVKEFAVRAIDGSDATKEGFQAIGYDAEDMAAKFAQGGDAARDAFRTVVAALSEMEDPIARDAAGVALFGAMWEDLGTGAVASLANITDSAYDCAGAMEGIKEVNYSSLSDALGGLQRQIELLIQPLGETLIPVIQEIISQISDAAEEFIPILTEKAEELINKLIPLIEPIMSLVTDILPDLMDIVTPIFDMLAEMLPQIIKLMKPIITALADIVEAILPPLTEFLSGQLMPIIIELVTMFTEQILPIIQKLIEGLLPPVLEILSAIMPLISTLLEILTPILDVILEMLDPIIALVRDAIAPLLVQLFSLINDILQPLMPLIQLVTGLITEQFGRALNFVCDLLGTVCEYFSSVFGSIKQVLGGVIDFIAGVFTGDWERAWKGVSDIFEGIWNGIKSAAEFVVNAVIDLINFFIENINTLFGWLGAKIEPLEHVDWTAGDAEEQAIEAVNGYNKKVKQQPDIVSGKKITELNKAPQLGEYGAKRNLTSAPKGAGTSISATKSYDYKKYTPEPEEREDSGEKTKSKSENSSAKSADSGRSSSSAGNFISITSYTPTVWDNAETANGKLAELLGTGIVGNSATAKAVTSLSAGGTGFSADSSVTHHTAETDKTLADVVKAINRLQKTVDEKNYNPSFELKARDLVVGKVAVKDINDISKRNGGKSPFNF